MNQMDVLKQGVQNALSQFGYRLSKINITEKPRSARPRQVEVPPIDPVWPLPRYSGMSDRQIRDGFAKYDAWHYAYAFDGGLSFPVRTSLPGPLTDDPLRHLKRFRHFMPYLVHAEQGSLRGKRVLDIACNSGFWSIQCALLGADVVGFDARPELISQANLIKAITGIQNTEFQGLDFWDMSPHALGGTFDIVLNLGILYHLPAPLEALRLTAAMARSRVLLDTEIYRSPEAAIQLRWEDPKSIRSANRSGIVALPSRQGLELMLKDLGAKEWVEIPIHVADMPDDYCTQNRASWLITM